MEKATKKLAEVEAFLLTVNTIQSRAGDNFAGQFPNVASKFSELPIKSVNSLVAEAMKPVFDDKVNKTTNKLNSMMELYIGEKWDDPIEVLEWSSFFAGAAAAHCAIARRLNRDNKQLTQELSSLQASFSDLLDCVITSLGS